MKNIHFTIRPYRDYSNKVNTEFIYLCLVTDNSDIVAKEVVRTSAWRDNENECQEYWKHHILSQVKDARGDYLLQKDVQRQAHLKNVSRHEVCLCD